MNKQDRRFLLISWALLLTLLLLVAFWGKTQIATLRQQIASLVGVKPTKQIVYQIQPNQRVQVIGPIGPIGIQGLPGLPGLIGVQGNTGATGTKGADGKNGKNGRDARQVEFCQLPDGTYGQKFVDDDNCDPIETSDGSN